MEPNKLEQDIQQKLQQRTIMPSASAWDRLDAMLTVAEQQAAQPEEETKVIPVKRKNRSWLYMAAAFLLLLGGGFFFMQQETTQNVIDTVTPQQVVTNETEQQDTESADATALTPVDSPAAKTPIVVYKRTDIAANLKEKQQEPIVIENNTPVQEIAQNTQPASPVKTENAEVKQRSLRVDPAALLASVESKKPGYNPAVANISQPKIKVNSENLLHNVETELDDNFRGKVLNSIEKKYKAVKSAVVSRNLE